jgi:hypothetical protein
MHSTHKRKKLNMQATVRTPEFQDDSVPVMEILGIHLDSELEWGPHVNLTAAKAASHMTSITRYRPERLPVLKARARILKPRLRLRLAATDPKTHRSVLSCAHDRTGRDASRGKDDRLYQIIIDGGGLACGAEVVLAAGYHYPVLAGKDNERCETKAKGAKAGDVCG